MASILRHRKGWRAFFATRGIRRSKVFASRAAAKAWAAREEYVIVEAAEGRADYGTFGDLLGRYAREVSAKKRGERWEVIRIARLRRDRIATVRLADLAPAHLADWRDRRLQEVAPASVGREMQLVSAALNMAIAIRRPPPGCIHHTDRGSQYCANDYQKLLRKHEFKVSMSGKGNCYDNSAVESFFKSLKAELVWRRNWQTRREVEVALFQYINGFYNPRRKHSALGWKSTVAFEQRAA